MMKNRNSFSARRRAVTALSVALFAGCQAGRQTASNPATPKSSSAIIDVPKVQITDFVLPNGLRVVLHEDHSSPIFSTDIWYHAGPKNEPAGRTGLAHMFEHMADEGTTHVAPGEYQQIIQEAGGKTGATTNLDNTSYSTFGVPSNMLETVLWLEADRMAYLTSLVDSARFETEREAVRNEYRQRILTVPAGGPTSLGAQEFSAAVWANTPYSTPLFGRMADLNAATLGDLAAFYKKYYVPNNAVLAIAGDFVTADVKKLIEKYFGPIARGAAVVQPTVAAVHPLAAERRIVLEDRVAPTVQLWIGWQGARSSSPDRPALMALSDILTNRLRQLLLIDRRIATGIPVMNAHLDVELTGIFQTMVAANGSLTEIERLVDSVVTSIRNEGVTAREVQLWAAPFVTNSLMQLQSTAAKATRMADGATIQGNPHAVFDEPVAARRVTAGDVQRVAQKYLVPQRVVMSIVPANKLDLISRPNEPYTNVTPPQ